MTSVEREKAAMTNKLSSHSQSLRGTPWTAQLKCNPCGWRCDTYCHGDTSRAPHRWAPAVGIAQVEGEQHRTGRKPTGYSAATREDMAISGQKASK